MNDPKQLTEEMPETPTELSNRGLILASGDIQPDKDQKIMTEDLPQEEDEEPGPQLLES